MVVAVAMIAAGVVAFLVWHSHQKRASTASHRQAGVSGDDPWSGSGTGTPGVLPRAGRLGLGGLVSKVGGPPVVITGTVRNAAGGTAVAGAEVAFMNETGEVTATADGSGRYSIKVTSNVWWKIHARSDTGVGYPEAFRPTADATRDLEIHALSKVRGRVVDARGAIVADADVNVEVEAGNKNLLEAAMTLSSKTDSAGRFELEALPGAANVRGAKGYAEGLAAVPQVAPGETAEVEIKLADPVVLRGHVVDESKQPVASAHLVALTTLAMGGINEKRTLDTGADGGFELIMPAGQLRLEAMALGKRAPTWAAFLESGTKRDDIELVLADQIGLRGKVVTTSGQPVVGARVRLIAASGYEGKTRGDGSFEVNVPEKLRYLVKVTHSDGRIEQWVDDWDNPPTLVMHQFGALHVKVTGGGGEATLRIDSFLPEGEADPRAPADSTFRGEKGAIEVAGLEPGLYDLTVSAPGSAPVRLPRTAIKETATAELTVALAAPVALRGTVTTGHKPVAGAQIAGAGATAYSDAQGRFSLDVAAGPVAVAVTKSGFGTAWVSATAAADGAPLAIELAPGDGGLVDGVGVVLAPGADGVTVASVLPGSPAAGKLAAGDRVVAIGDADVHAAALDEVVARLRGAAGSSVSIKVMRGADPTTVEVVRRRLETSGGPTVARVWVRMAASLAVEAWPC